MAFHSMVTMGSNNNKRAAEWERRGREARDLLHQFFAHPAFFAPGFILSGSR